MRLVIEVEPEEYEDFVGRDLLALTVREVEVRQDGGLLMCTKKVALVEGIGGATLSQHGLESGPAMRVFCKTPGKE